MKSAIYGIVLAGGRSSRMGTNKALLPIRGVPMIRHVTNLLQPLCREVVVVANDPSLFPFLRDVRWAADVYPGKGPLAGIHAGLAALPEDAYGFVMACDMPVISVRLFAQMVELIPGPDAVACPNQPFHALYRRSVVPTIEHLLQNQILSVKALLDAVDTTYLDPPDEDCFLNVNTPEEYERLLRIL